MNWTEWSSSARNFGHRLLAKALLNWAQIIKFLFKKLPGGATSRHFRWIFKGSYIIQDGDFYTIASFSEGTQYISDSIPYLALPAGIIRGTLDNLGIPATVTVQVERLPSVKFNVQLIKQQQWNASTYIVSEMIYLFTFFSCEVIYVERTDEAEIKVNWNQ
jgi:hypothetical protein